MARIPLVQAIPVAPELQREAHVGQTLPALPSDGIAEAVQGVGAQFAQIGKRIGQIADHAAEVEGKRAGHLAGLDPEFRPSNVLTLRAEAFDKAGLQTALARTRVDIEADVEAEALRHQANPGGLQKALAAKRQGWLAGAPIELHPEIEVLFKKTSTTAVRVATREMWARQNAELQATLQTELQDTMRRAHQRAFALGLDPAADEIAVSDMGTIGGILARRGVNGERLVPPAAAAKLLAQAKEEVTTARLMGAFGRLGTPEEKERFIGKLEEDFAKSDGLAKNYDFATFRQVSDRLRAELNRDLVQRRTSVRELESSLKIIEGWAANGEVPRPDMLAAIKGRIAAEAPQMQPALDEALNLLQVSQSWRRLTPEQMDTVVRGLRESVPEVGQDRRREAYIGLAESILTKMRAGIKEDGLGWAERSGVIDKIQPLDPGDAGSLRRRIAQVDELRRYYGAEIKILRPDEDRRLEALLAEGGDKALAVAAAIASAAPDRATEILSQLDKKQAPHLAQLGLLVAERADPRFVAEAANGLALKRVPGFKPAGEIKAAERNEALREVLGSMPGIAPSALVGPEALADAAYEVWAQSARPATFDRAQWQRRFRAAVGEREIGGTVYGGLSPTGRGWISDASTVVIPPNIAQRQFTRVLDAIKPEDLPGLVTGHGKPVTQSELWSATLVQQGAAQYRLQLGQDSDGRPRFLMGPGNRPFVLDLKALEPTLRQRVPQAYLGATP